jgi:hypothetical protein
MMEKDPSQLAPLEKLGAAAFGKVCDAYSTNPGLMGIPGGPNDMQYRTACQPYYAKNGYQGPKIVPPDFQGGQCIGVQYSFKFKLQDIYGSPPDYQTKVLTGPVGAIYYEDYYEYGNFRRFLIPEGVGQPSQSSALIGSLAANRSGYGAPIVTVESVTPLNGALDNCGSLNTTVAPGTAPSLQWNQNTTINVDGRTYNVKVNQPVTNNIDKSLTVPVLINGDVNLGFGGSGGNASESASVANVRPSVSAGLPIGGPIHEGLNEKFPNPPEGKEYVGCIVELFNVETGTPPIPSSMPDKIWPLVVGNARLIYANSGIGDILGDSRMVREDMFTMFRPTDRLKVVGARMRLSYPGTYSIIPLLADKPE